MLQVETYIVGPVLTNCYLIRDEATGRCALIDPGENTAELEAAVCAEGKDRFDYIFLTHGHFDHIGAVEHYQKLTGARLVLCRKEEPFLRDPSLNLSSLVGRKIFSLKADALLDDGESVFLGESEIRLLYTPGHTFGSCCYLSGSFLFSGDTLFFLGAGRTDLATGEEKALRLSLKKLFSLSGDFTVCPGHDARTTLCFERENNPYSGR